MDSEADPLLELGTVGGLLHPIDMRAATDSGSLGSRTDHAQPAVRSQKQLLFRWAIRAVRPGRRFFGGILGNRHPRAAMVRDRSGHRAKVQTAFVTIVPGLHAAAIVPAPEAW
jgi:hypothetical protein